VGGIQVCVGEEHCFTFTQTLERLVNSILWNNDQERDTCDPAKIEPNSCGLESAANVEMSTGTFKDVFLIVILEFKLRNFHLVWRCRRRGN
jgi:hypothetical protein